MPATVVGPHSPAPDRGHHARVPEESGHGNGASTEDRNALTRKLDVQLIPVIMLLYLFSFLDRVNIGNARLYGLEKDLGLTGNQYQVCVSILFVTYCLFEVPSNLLLKKINPRRYIAFITSGWGVVAALTGVCQSYGGLIAVRLILGLLEAGLFPGLIIYLTMFYTRGQLAVRVGYLFVASAIAGAVGGMIAYGVGFTDGVSGLRAWRWLMIIEGIPAFVLGIAAYIILPASLETARFLSSEERARLVAIRRSEVGQAEGADKFHWADVREGARDWQIWAFGAASFSSDILFYGFSTFLPTIIEAIGSWSALQSQALTVPVYAAGTSAYLIVAHLSDRSQKRGVYSVAAGLICLVGYALLLANRGPATSYAGCFVVALGLYILVGLPLAWLPGNKPRYAKRTFATGLQLTLGNMAGIAAPFLYRTVDAPAYRTGYSVSIAACFFSASVFAFMSWYYRRVNMRRARGDEDWRLDGKTDADVDSTGDLSPRYVYAT